MCINTHDRVITITEIRFGRVTGTEVAHLAAMFGLKIDKVKVVVFGNRMWFGTNGDAIGSFADAGDDRNMFLMRGIYGVRFKFLHRLVAAGGCDTGVDNTENDVSTNGAKIKFGFHSCINVNN